MIYRRTIREQTWCATNVEVEADVYDVLVAWSVACPARQHAIKKLLMAGQRGVKSTLQDLEEARDAVTRAIELERARS